MMSFRRILCLLLLTLTSQGWTTSAFAENTPGTSAKSAVLRLGLLPYLSPQLLMKTYQPLIDYLEQHLDRPVMALSAPDFQTYINRSAEGHYDIYLTAPHLAAAAEMQHKARRLSRFTRQLHGVIVVHANSSIQSVDDLRGARMATPDPMAVITLLGEQTLLKHGLRSHIDLDVTHMKSHNAVMLAVADGKIDAAIAGAGAYGKMPDNVKNSLRIIETTASVPHMMFMARADLPEEEYSAAKNALLHYKSDGAGHVFFTGQGKVYENMGSITEHDMLSLANLVSLLDHGKQGH